MIVMWLPKRWQPSLRRAGVHPVLAIIPFLVGDWLSGRLGFEHAWSLLNQLGTMSARFQTWRSAFYELLAPKWIQLIGYGYKGDITSGVAKTGKELFGGSGSVHYGPHNVVLQYILDNGYIGAALFVAVMFLTLGRLARSAADGPADGFQPALALMLAIALLGTIERIPTVYTPQLITVFLFVVIQVLFVPELSHGAERDVIRSAAREPGSNPSEATNAG